MRILHYYPKDDQLVSLHVDMLCHSMGLEAENHTATEADKARTLLRGGNYDVLHLHGCWRNSLRTIAGMARKQGTRLVVTPHGGLEPWVMDERRWKEKLPKRVLYQRDIVRSAYAVIVQGKMELQGMEQLGWNPRTVTIRNSAVTSSITPKEMARQTFAVYRKVMDSNTLELMTEDTVSTLHDILKAGITGDSRWVTDSPGTPHSTGRRQLTADDWRQVYCYAHQEALTDTLERGIRVLRLQAPDIDPDKLGHFLPTGYTAAESIAHETGDMFASENDRLMATFRVVRRLALTRRLSMHHLVELDRELRQYYCEEDKLCEELREHHLYKLAARTMALMQQLTGLDEGFMPMPPLNDRLTRQMCRQTTERLKIQ